MYTHCTVRWEDDGTEEDVIIKADDSLDANDNMIFFYGYDRYDLLRAMENGWVLQDGWRVTRVGNTYDGIYET